MIDVNPFKSCSRMPSPCRSPLAVRAGISSSFISECPKDNLDTQRTPRHTAPQCSSYLPLRFDRSYPLP